MQAQYKAKRGKRQGTPIYRADGKVIGTIRGDTFYKRIKTSHFLEKPHALASDVDALKQAEQAGANFFCAHHVETGIDYRTPIERFWERGFPVNRGYGAQVGLRLSDFNCDDAAPTNKPTQLPLFNLSPLLR